MTARSYELTMAFAGDRVKGLAYLVLLWLAYRANNAGRGRLPSRDRYVAQLAQAANQTVAAMSEVLELLQDEGLLTISPENDCYWVVVPGLR
jgi:hypothetical protein